MDPITALGLGASIVSFIDVGLKATKKIHSLLSGIKDGPQYVEQTSRNVYDLLSALEQISKCPMIDENNDKTLTVRLLACLNDLQMFDRELQQLSIDDSERRLGKYWKKVKTVWNEKALARMGSVISGHTAALNLHLNILHSNAMHSISSQLQAVSLSLAAQQTASAAHMGTLNGQYSVLQSVSANVAEIKERFATTDGWQQPSSSIPASRDDGETKQIVTQILDHVIKLSSPLHPSRIDASEVRAVPRNKARTSKRKRLQTKFIDEVSRLCSMAITKQGKKVSDEADDIMGYLSAALNTIISSDFLETFVLVGLIDEGFCSNCSKRRLGELRSVFRTVCGALSLVQEVVLNEAGKPRPREGLLYDQQHWKIQAYNIEIGTLTIAISTKQLSTGVTAIPNDKSQTRLTTTISFVPKHTQIKQLFAITTSQIRTGDGVFSSIPRLSVNNIIPASSPVFSIVKSGQMDKFQALLSRGEASLRDHDEYGAPLLHYAYLQPEMCQYLLNSGADTDYVASYAGCSEYAEGYIGTVLLASSTCDDDMDGEELEKLLACRRLLLDAGVDFLIPEITPEMREHHWVPEVCFQGVPAAMKMVFDLGSLLIDTNCIIEDQPPLLHLCRGGRWTEASFDLLIRRGADISSRNPRGETCLHLCLQREMGVWRCSQALAALVYLVQCGADVFAIDNFGSSVSDVAYAHEDNIDDYHRDSSIVGDVWDAALASCGYSIVEFRRKHPRRARYTKFYTRGVFESLWKGREHLCPYYNDDDNEDMLVTTDSDDTGELESNYSDSDSEDGGTTVHDHQNENELSKS